MGGIVEFRKDKKGQMMEMPFQLIFSLILIAIFLYAAFTGTKYLLERADQAKIGQFYVELQSTVYNTWQATEKQQTYSFDLPNRVDYVCFGDLSGQINGTTVCPDFGRYQRQAVADGANVLLCPPSKIYGIGAPIYSRIDCNGAECLEFVQPVYCVRNTGELKITLKKEFGQPNVLLS